MYTVFGFGNIFYVFEVGAIAIPGWLIAALGFLIFEAALAAAPAFGVYFLAVLFMITAMLEQISFRDKATYSPRYVSAIKVLSSIAMNAFGYLITVAAFLMQGAISGYSTLTDAGWLNTLLSMVLLGQLGRFCAYIVAACLDGLTKWISPKFSTFMSAIGYLCGTGAYLVIMNHFFGLQYYSWLKFGLALVFGGAA